MELHHHLSIIVPVFNEEKTISRLLKAVLNYPLAEEVIVVDDGSIDRSWQLIKKIKNPKLKKIHLRKNHGKGYALAKGIEKARGEVVIFIDADLVNLRSQHIDTLYKKLLKRGKQWAVVGYPTSGFLPSAFADFSGERGYYRQDLFPLLNKMKKARFGVEALLNNYFRNKTIKVPLKNLKGLYKYEKHSSKEAIKEYIREIIEVGQTILEVENLNLEDKLLIEKIKNLTDLAKIEKKLKHLHNKSLYNFVHKYIGFIKNLAGKK